MRIGVSRWSGDAWATIALTAAFLAMTCWWLTQDRSIPIYDAGDHLEAAFQFHDMIRAGNLLGPFNFASPYPPLAVTVGALAALIGGVNVASPIVGENLVFVPLLVLGVYRTGRLLFGARAGLLAAAFVLGSPLLIAQLHVFMLDAPETALVAVAIWLLLACEDFSRFRYAALAGVAVGAGMLIKVQFAPFVLGIVAMVVLRGGRRNRRGLIAFAAIALVIAVPWYLNHLSEFSTFARDADPHAGVPTGDAPATLSLANFVWYFWNMLNSQFLLPLFALIVGGTCWMVRTLFAHRREALATEPGAKSALTTEPERAIAAPAAPPAPPGSATADRGASQTPVDRGPFDVRLEFFVGAVVAWLLITLTPSHDIRYGMPMMPYLAVIATGWIVYLRRPARLIAVAIVVIGVSANTLATTFGVGGTTVQVAFVHPLPAGEEFADSIRIYSSEGFLVAGPRRDGDVPGLLEDLRRSGVRTVGLDLEQSALPDFSFEGLLPLMRVAGLSAALTTTIRVSPAASTVMLVHEPVGPHAPPPCATLSDGTGVWVIRYDTAARRPALYCPRRRPSYYDVGAVG